MLCLVVCLIRPPLVEESQYFSSRLFASGFFMGHDPVGGTDENVTKLTGRKKIDNPLLNLIDLDIETGTDNTTFIDASSQFHNNLAGSVVVNDLEFSNVTCSRPYGKGNRE